MDASILQRTPRSHSSKNDNSKRWILWVFTIMIIMLTAMTFSLVYIIIEINISIPNRFMEHEIMEKAKITKRSTNDSQLPKNIPGLEAIQMHGAVPMLRAKKSGTIGPWKLENGQEFDWAILNKARNEVTILHSGMYFVYAQIYYITNEAANSFSVARKRNGGEIETISACSSQPMTAKGPNMSQISCYTGVVASLNVGDNLSIHQIQENRIILLQEGYSHWGLIRLYDSQVKL